MTHAPHTPLTLRSGLTPNRVRTHILAHPLTFVICLLGVMTAGVLGEPLVLLAALGATGSAVGASPWISPLVRHAIHREQRRARLRAQQRARATERRLLAELAPPHVERYLELKARVQEVPRALERAERDQVLDQVQSQLRELLLAYLRLLAALHNLDRLLLHVDELALYRQLDAIDAELHDASPRLASVKESRRQLLQRRLRRLDQSREGREILLTQLEMIEDIVSLLRDASLAAPDPGLLNAQLSELMTQIEAADEAVLEVQSLHDDAHQLAVFEERITASS